MKRKITIVIISVLLAFVLTGCAGIYDFLNFNRIDIPDLPSEVDQNLTVQTVRPNIMTQTQFDNLIAQTKTAMDGHSDERVHYTWRTPLRFSNDHGHSSSTSFATVYLKTAPSSSQSGAEGDSAVPFAMVDGQVFFDDFFVFDSTKFVWGDYLEHFRHDRLEFAKEGSMLLSLLSLISDNLVSVDGSRLNGREIYTVQINPSAALAMAASRFNFDAFNFDAINAASADFVRASATFNQTTVGGVLVIDAVSVQLQFTNETLTVFARANSFGDSDIDARIPSMTRSAYMLVLEPLITWFENNWTIEYRAELSFHGLEFDWVDYAEYTIYRGRTQSHYGTEFIYIADLGNNTRVYRNRWGGMVLARGGVTTVIEHSHEDWWKYNNLFSRFSPAPFFVTVDFRQDFSRVEFDAENSTFTFLSEQWRNEFVWDDEIGGSVWVETLLGEIYHKYTVDFSIDFSLGHLSAASQITAFEHGFIPYGSDAGEVSSSINFDYDFDFFVPANIMNLLMRM